MPAGLITGKIDNEAEEVPSVILEPIAVTKENINETVVKDGYWQRIRNLHRPLQSRVQGSRDRIAEADRDRGEPYATRPVLTSTMEIG